ncbi:MAG TPA: DUF2784 domain-containing protein [Micropepsaceae bacterium]|nr:DUF2784 domain-containing protein [Micropepsaceae bacterium]
MTPYLILADLVLALHLGVIAFNVFGLIAIPLGALVGWRFVRIFWWRALHVGILGIVALQAVAGRACFLTDWHAALVRAGGWTESDAPLIERLVERLIFWPVPSWVFVALYLVVCAYTLALWRLVPPRRVA